MKTTIHFKNQPSAQAIRNALQVIADALNKRHGEELGVEFSVERRSDEK